MRLADYIAELTVTQGAGAGEPLRLLPWQRRFLAGFERTDGDCAITIGRGNGKTTLIAGIACATLDGPLMQRRAETVIVASSFMQARVAYEHVQAFMREKGHDLDDRKRWRLQDSQNAAVIEDRRTGARVRCIGSDPARAHGLAPALVVADEPSQWPGPTSERMRAALVTSMGKIDGSRLIALGTRPADASHWFEAMLNGGCAYFQVHAAREDDPPFHRRTWLRANPSLPIMPALDKRIRQEAEDAKRDPSLLAAFKALRLNLGIDDTLQSTLLDAGTWERVEGEAERSGPFVLGIDLGGASSMSAAAAYWPESTAFDVFGCFPNSPDLRQRGLSDGCGRLYMDMFARGELILAGGRVADVGAVLAEVLTRWGMPAAIVADRWRIPELRDALDAARFPAAALVERGMGYRDGGIDVADFRRAVLRGRVTPTRSLLMRSAMGEARVTMDTAANAKIAKYGAGKRSRGRDDAACAGMLADCRGRAPRARSATSRRLPGASLSRYTKRLDARRWAAVRRFVLDRDRSRCQSCGRVVTYRPEIDHVVPLSKGGTEYDPANLQTLCRTCHHAKTASEQLRPDPGRSAWRRLVAEFATK